MRILLTNDDGVNSPGIVLLAAGLREAGHRVFVVAPVYNQSGVSQSITFVQRPCKLIELTTDTWGCEGTPADCVMVALAGGIPELSLPRWQEGTAESVPPDLIISGINRGSNMSVELFYSGTAGAARQGALFGIPSLAFSLIEGDVYNWEMAVIFVVERLAELYSRWKPDSFLNINIPNQREVPSSLVNTFPSLRYHYGFMDIYHAADGCRYCFAGKEGARLKPEPGSDWEAIEGNNVSISELFIHPVLLESVREGKAQ